MTDFQDPQDPFADEEFMPEPLPEVMPEPPPEVMPQEIVQHGGWMVDPKTGEVLGHADLNEDYRVTSEGSADYVVEQMLEEDAEIAKLRQMHLVILNAMERRIQTHQRRRDWLQRRFASDLQQWAAAEIAGGKRRSVQLPHGTLAFRRSESLSVVENRKDEAVQWCNTWCREAVKVVTSVLTTPLKSRTDLPEQLFVREVKNSFKIDTGVGE